MLKRRIELFSLDNLVNLATRAGLRVELKVRPESCADNYGRKKK